MEQNEEIEIEMTKDLLKIDEELKKKKVFDINEINEIVSGLMAPYESTFLKGDRHCLCEGCYRKTQKPGCC